MHKSDILIIGGGLAGLTTAIHLSKSGLKVTLIEKDSYPRHKVCGEYISNEVRAYLKFLNLDIDALDPVNIDQLEISTQSGKLLKSNLPLGGFGISRYTLDHYLWNKAEENKVQLIVDTVTDVYFNDSVFTVSTLTKKRFKAIYVIGAQGKRSNLDKHWDRKFMKKKSPWLGIKMHYRGNFDTQKVALHNFKGGYCGISKVERGIINVCYLVKYSSFKKYKDIDAFQEHVLANNYHLKSFFEQASPVLDQYCTISQISFERKVPYENNIFMIGDAAGLIHPLCGNGMAMAIESSRLLATLIVSNKQDLIANRSKIAKAYEKSWNANFKRRLRFGRVLQYILLNETLQQLAYGIAKWLPFLVPKIIKKTHGKPSLC
ncbi:NAD(P)/FAD-dependent oxidoreductase [Aquimarina brevivitae]|uniref:Flavin-dependent dehydrogenase n=1 Tax=Aquimarina brevivitae TaxID=323412 RepID=A0A4Q7P2K4_9FLAO|nr:NAD(P)/FAD-dependent oxidoreductase [Aquimarina brevivitae]RZS93837.1 flavin-dependent dehydrogenase [Aquimarina brevivitae]